MPFPGSRYNFARPILRQKDKRFLKVNLIVVRIGSMAEKNHLSQWIQMHENNDSKNDLQ